MNTNSYLSIIDTIDIKDLARDMYKAVDTDERVLVANKILKWCPSADNTILMFICVNGLKDKKDFNNLVNYLSFIKAKNTALKHISKELIDVIDASTALEYKYNKIFNPIMYA